MTRHLDDKAVMCEPACENPHESASTETERDRARIATGTSPPCAEHGPNGGGTCAEPSTGRDGRGRFAPGTRAGLMTRFKPGEPGRRLTHGMRSAHRWRELQPLRTEMRERWLTDKGFTEGTVPLAVSLVIDRAIEAAMKCNSFFQALIDGPGPVTASGRRARIAEHHRRETETFLRVVAQLGIERQPRAAGFAERLASKLAEAKDK